MTRGHPQAAGRVPFHRIQFGSGGEGFRSAPTRSTTFTIPAWSINPSRAHALMRAAAAADQPGSSGMCGAGGTDDRDNEWTLISVCIHEAAHAVVAERWSGVAASIRIERDARLGHGSCVVPSLAVASPHVQRQFGMAGLVGELQARHGSYLSLDVALEAFRRGPISPNDLTLMRGVAPAAELDVCMRRVHTQWADVIGIARNLVATELQHYCGTQR